MPRPSITWTPELDAKIIELFSSGVSDSKIGKSLGISKNAVVGRRQRLKNGIKARKKMTPEELAESARESYRRWISKPGKREHCRAYRKNYMQIKRDDGLPPEGPVIICSLDGKSGAVMAHDFEGSRGSRNE